MTQLAEGLLFGRVGLDTVGHAIEGGGQGAQLVLARRRQARLELAGSVQGQRRAEGLHPADDQPVQQPVHGHG